MGKKTIERNIALCYLRNSVLSEDLTDKSGKAGINSTTINRQRDNTGEVCRKRDWIPEFYIDAGKSGRGTDERVDWQRLEQDLENPRVVAVVANDLSRLHRNSLNTQLFIKKLQERDIKLVLVNSPLGEIDISSIQGKLLLQVLSWADEMYADSIAEKARDSVRHRKSRGISVGKPPFGTQRNSDGYLEPSPLGVWCMPDGTWKNGTKEENPPDDMAVWRGDYDCAKRILELYVSDQILGNTRIAYQLQEEGRAFRDRYYQPRHVEAHDVRRVVSNYLEYGGIVTDDKAKDRPGYQQDEITIDTFNLNRAVFPAQLLVDVATMRKYKSRKPSNRSNIGTRHYSFSQLIHCAHCERSAINNGKAKTIYLGSKTEKGVIKYFHRQGRKCDCKRKSVRQDVIAPDFEKLLSILVVNPEYVETMQMTALNLSLVDESKANELEKMKRMKIATLKRALANMERMSAKGIFLFEDIEADYDDTKRQIAYWEAFTTDVQEIQIELLACATALINVQKAWHGGSEKHQNKLVQDIFTYITYDLDIQRIVSFGIQPWASRFLVIRGKLYEDALIKDKGIIENQGGITHLPHRSIEIIARFDIQTSTQILLIALYHNDPQPVQPQRQTTPPKTVRNKRICERHAEGEPYSVLARDYGISEQRIAQIVKRKKQ